MRWLVNTPAGGVWCREEFWFIKRWFAWSGARPVPGSIEYFTPVPVSVTTKEGSSFLYRVRCFAKWLPSSSLLSSSIKDLVNKIQAYHRVQRSTVSNFLSDQLLQAQDRYFSRQRLHQEMIFIGWELQHLSEPFYWLSYSQLCLSYHHWSSSSGTFSSLLCVFHIDIEVHLHYSSYLHLPLKYSHYLEIQLLGLYLRNHPHYFDFHHYNYYDLACPRNPIYFALFTT